MSTVRFPLTSDELRGIANRIDAVVEILSPLIDSPEVMDIVTTIIRPDTEDEVVGEIKFYDGWLGYFPYPVA